MALGDGTQWDETEPSQSTEASTIDSYDRDLRVGVRSRMGNEHFWPSSQTGTAQAGQHTYLTFQAQNAFPGFVNNNSGTSLQLVGLWVDSSFNVWLSNTSTTGPNNLQIIAGTMGIYTATATTASAPGLGIAINSSNGRLLLSGSLGTWSAKTINTTYQAPSDGFITCQLQATTNNCIAQFYTDSGNPPSTYRSACQLSVSQGNLTGFVRKGDYWVIVTTAGAAFAVTNIYFLPLGL